tara:strand:- start:12918 stop:13070 length:153 start_codon:yes stop_codon:yes gene_type:complete
MPSILQIIGLLAIVLGVGFIYWPAGLIVAGLSCALMGFLLEIGLLREREQ